MKDINQQDFGKEVLERSATVPVVVDFWAPWCGPCRVLGPVLESAVEAMGGRVELVKLNTDESPELAAQFQIQGIPAVKAFRDGKVVAEFVGAQPAPAVKRFLEQLAPPPALAALAKAEAALQAGRADEAEPQLRALSEDPLTSNRAHLLLAGLSADANRADEARTHLAAIDARSAEALEIPAIERRLALGADAAAYGGESKAHADLEANPKDLEARYALASALAARGELRPALEHFLEIAGRNRKFKDDGARLAMLSIFERLGNEHELTQEFRRRLQIVL
jgi:putative thioredoxin